MSGEDPYLKQNGDEVILATGYVEEGNFGTKSWALEASTTPTYNMGKLKDSLQVTSTTTIDEEGAESTAQEGSKQEMEVIVIKKSDSKDAIQKVSCGTNYTAVNIAHNNCKNDAEDEKAMNAEEEKIRNNITVKDSAPNGRLYDEGTHKLKHPVIKEIRALDLSKTIVTPKKLSPPQSPRLKRAKKGIFVTYSPDAGFLERKFVVEMVRQLKENNLAEDLWFDKDEKNTGNPCWFAQRMEAVEKCRAAIMVLSWSYFRCPVSVYEGKVLLERLKLESAPLKVFSVLFSQVDTTDVPKQYQAVLSSAVDLTTAEHVKKSSAEKTSVVIGAIMEELEKSATVHAPPTPFTPPDTEFTGEYKHKKICLWTAADLQEWLFNLGIKEFYRQSLAEAMIDGFLLMSLTDRDMVAELGVDSRVVRKKLMQQILLTLDKEHKQTDNWHLRARSQRSKPDVVYLIYDPVDVRLAHNLKEDLKKKNLQVVNHDSTKLGRSKEEFLHLNGPSIAQSMHVVVVMTDAIASSPFIFHEVLFADWLGKKLVTAMFKNVWSSMRFSLRAVLGDCPAVDFETKMYAESLEVLEHHVKPLHRVPGVILEQTYLNKMADGLKPLEQLATTQGGMNAAVPSDEEPKVFISYQWDMQSKVDEVKVMLERCGIPCWTDIAMSQQRGQSSRSSRSSVNFSGQVDSSSDTLLGQIHRSMRHASVVLCFLTPKYLQSDNCSKDLSLAEAFNKPIIPLLLRFTPFESAPAHVRRILLRHNYVDLSTDRLYKQNVSLVLEKVKRVIMGSKESS